jgi:hypothetical protein
MVASSRATATLAFYRLLVTDLPGRPEVHD